MRCRHSHCMLSCGAVTAIAPQPLHAVRSQPLHAFCHSKLSPHRGQPVCEINIKVNQCVRSIMSPCIPRPMSAHLSVDTFRGRAVNLKPQTMFNSRPTAIYTCSRRLFELFRQLVHLLLSLVFVFLQLCSLFFLGTTCACEVRMFQRAHVINSCKHPRDCSCTYICADVHVKMITSSQLDYCCVP